MSEFNEEFDEIRVTETNQTNDGWTFLVELGYGDGLAEYIVDVDVDYWTKLTGRRIEPDELVKTSFEFLLSKEQKELIFKKFNLADVSGSFPMYESEIKRRL